MGKGKDDSLSSHPHSFQNMQQVIEEAHKMFTFQLWLL